MTQDRSSWEKSSARPMEGSATLTMDASRTTTNCAAASRASANQRLSVDVDDAEDKGGSWGGVTVIDLDLGLRAARPHRGLAHIEGLRSGGGALGRVVEAEVRFRFQRYGIDFPVVKPYSDCHGKDLGATRAGCRETTAGRRAPQPREGHGRRPRGVRRAWL